MTRPPASGRGAERGRLPQPSARTLAAPPGAHAHRHLDRRPRSWSPSSLFFVDHSLGYAVLIGGAIYWLAKLPYWPHRIVGTAAFIALLALLALVGIDAVVARRSALLRARRRARAVPVALARAAGRRS